MNKAERRRTVEIWMWRNAGEYDHVQVSREKPERKPGCLCEWEGEYDVFICLDQIETMLGELPPLPMAPRKVRLGPMEFV